MRPASTKPRPMNSPGATLLAGFNGALSLLASKFVFLPRRAGDVVTHPRTRLRGAAELPRELRDTRQNRFSNGLLTFP
jgi:hypothetical protein